ncbi:hypothetical protein [Halalkalibacter okhensis]|uniref:Cthe-2314-like HEPN domain-containing protein n=1 Tax=Halalkalibacter okhensis TaxID=333138 RepID=A0A0B0IHD7_9BACI|nr:hypothetical protein [Halalkalibacter okhensis]KHF40715.1 hypothetical protein LQ50_07945 [Halalkalibacter okhensis]
MILKPILGVSELFYRNDLRNLQELIDRTESYLEKETVEFNKIVETNASKLPEDERDYYYDHMSEDYFKLSDEFPQTIRQSMFLQAFFSFENVLNDICSWLQKKREIKIGFKDISGQGIIRTKVYLSKIFMVKDTFDSIEWQHIRHYNSIRNIFVHNGGYPVNDKKEHKQAIDQLDHLFVNEDYGKVYLNKDFCYKVIETINKFLFNLRNEFIEKKL